MTDWATDLESNELRMTPTAAPAGEPGDRVHAGIHAKRGDGRRRARGSPP